MFELLKEYPLWFGSMFFTLAFVAICCTYGVLCHFANALKAWGQKHCASCSCAVEDKPDDDEDEDDEDD